MVERVSTVGSRRMTKVFATRLQTATCPRGGGGAGISEGPASCVGGTRGSHCSCIVNGKVYCLTESDTTSR